MANLAVAIIGRDKFSRVVQTVRSMEGQLHKGSMVYLFDVGYPRDVLTTVIDCAHDIHIPLTIVQSNRFANTNVVWNQFLKISGTYDALMALENDVTLDAGCVDASLSVLCGGTCDIVVPVVFEVDLFGQRILHFDPQISSIVTCSDGSIVSTLDRGRTGGATARGQVVKHLERHCFFMTPKGAARLGSLDEKMYCRTDYDMSLQANATGLKITIPDGSVTFTQTPNFDIDREFFDYRWNLARVAFANARLIAKWQLRGFKTTIEHAHQARRLLTMPV